MPAIVEYEQALTKQLIAGLRAIKGVTIHGKGNEGRVPTVALTIKGKSPADVARALAKDRINVWHGHNYGWEPVRRLGLLESGGVVRVSLAQYNTSEEVNYFLEKIAELVAVGL
jgi:selenocysteine lyase/cysteine desulfurase